MPQAFESLREPRDELRLCQSYTFQLLDQKLKQMQYEIFAL